MNKITLLLSLISLPLLAQTKLEKGYIIDLNNQTIPVEIYYQDWAKNPNEIEAKINGELKKYTPKTIKEFGLENGINYVSYNGKIDNSSQFYNRISETKQPEWVETSTFLKTTVNGPSKLYVHDNNTTITYFFSKEDGEIKPLIYKIYKETQTTTSKNEQFKNQLRSNVYCGDVNVNKVNYTKNSLEKYFIDYNSCITNGAFKHNKDVSTKNIIEFGVQAGIRSEKNYVHYTSYDVENKFNGTSPTFGVNAEYQLPFLKNKYAIALEANYFHFKRQDVQASPRFGLAIERKIIEIPIGIKYYIKNDNEHKVFLDAFYNAKINLSDANYTEVVYSESAKTEIANMSSFSIGAGYQWKNLGLKARYNLKSSFDVGTYMSGDTSSFSLNLFYKFARIEF
ncbi:porin family protein [Faecalibacter macacae]|uniref:Uncharacterized protein n=1 Tax=Faecalibacter macacae TaxID=1859289 RepID=A0A3L9MJC9_9FLAO|nr:outer membrane beta-barrel protein [Faecalibacter macacae]RLZ11394.1 hypothetical protein EAH69_04940 [Faecalibacter macacae]